MASSNLQQVTVTIQNPLGLHARPAMAFVDLTNTFKENMKTGFVWDDDNWAMNQWGHPLHGGQFFNAARTNGYDFWGSIPFTVTGSMIWELFMEAEPPSINDLISLDIFNYFLHYILI